MTLLLVSVFLHYCLITSVKGVVIFTYIFSQSYNLNPASPPVAFPIKPQVVTCMPLGPPLKLGIYPSSSWTLKLHS